MNEQHYCLVKLAESNRVFMEITKHLPKVKERYDKHRNTGTNQEIEALADLQKIVKNLWNEFKTVISSYQELEDDVKVQTALKLYTAVKKFNYFDGDYSKLLAALAGFAASFPTEQNLNVQLIGRLMNRVKMGYFPTDLNHVELIKNAIVFPEMTVNILDPCSGCGLALSYLADGENAVTYGTELDDYRASESEKRIDRVGIGSFFHSRISHDAFHCIFLNPPYLSVINEGGGSTRLEKTFLAGTLPHLMVDGLLVYIVPYYRMTSDICRVFCDNFTDITVYRFDDSEFKKFKQVAIFAKRKKRDDGLPLVEEFQNRFISPEQIPYLTDIGAGRYELPKKEKNVDLFKGAKFNLRELSQQLQKSVSTKALFDASKLEQIEKHPPLPLNVSQIGLVGGSGMMNGLVECDSPHLIKGRIVKQHKSEILTENTEAGKTTELREVTSNRMIFNILTPAGYKSLS